MVASKPEEDRSAEAEPEQLETQISKPLDAHPSLLPELNTTESVDSNAKKQLEASNHVLLKIRALELRDFLNKNIIRYFSKIE